VPKPPGDAEQVAGLDVAIGGQAGEGQAVGLHLSALEAGHRHLRAGQAGEELMRPGEVEMGDSGVDGEDNAQGIGGHDEGSG